MLNITETLLPEGRGVAAIKTGNWYGHLSWMAAKALKDCLEWRLRPIKATAVSISCYYERIKDDATW
ncbi:MAG TPA: hypothetical protein IAD32_01520 [Candidatus Scatavimonas merdigallinarum]|uniref:Uncharacterized protein n=1 Tax=Candidatus Scatavimonas merdigallinarum TaxID=2840914 RepID=A0A9D0ZG05_9FIRM|nr:hypothetical protein [Candidatus Scatavimonas merdigallinarum]